MKLYFDHVLGKQESKDFIFSLVTATFENSEWDWAFENGWSPTQKWFESTFANNNLIWYQSRQSRINLKLYKPNPKTKKLVNRNNLRYSISNSLECSIETIYDIYIKYCEHKSFGDLIDKNTFTNYFIGNNYYYIHYYYNNTLVALTKLSLWNKSLFSELFWWNYNNPELSLGKLSFYLEAELAKSLQLPYLYIGLSYDANSIYKSDKHGFEFWTGREWLSDKELFKYLCNKDSSITTIEELHDYQYEYLKLMKV